MPKSRPRREIAAPKPLSPLLPGGDLAEKLIRFDVPDCDCKTSRLCMAGPDGRYPDVCPGPDACDECPPALNLRRPCPHVQAVLERFEDDGPDELEEKAEMLARLQRAYDAEGYGDRPPPPPGAAFTEDARVALYAQRAERGYALFSEADVVGAVLTDRIAVQGVAVRDSGEIVTGRGRAR
jgi:hypothetical protein